MSQSPKLRKTIFDKGKITLDDVDEMLMNDSRILLKVLKYKSDFESK